MVTQFSTYLDLRPFRDMILNPELVRCKGFESEVRSDAGACWGQHNYSEFRRMVSQYHRRISLLTKTQFPLLHCLGRNFDAQACLGSRDAEFLV